MQDVTPANRSGAFSSCAAVHARRRVRGFGLDDHRYFPELRAALEPVEGGADIGHGEAAVDDRLHEAAIEYIEELPQFADASARGPVDFELADEDALQIRWRVGAGRGAACHEPTAPAQGLQGVSQLAAPPLSITMSTPPPLMSRMALETLSFP